MDDEKRILNLRITEAPKCKFGTFQTLEILFLLSVLLGYQNIQDEPRTQPSEHCE